MEYGSIERETYIDASPEVVYEVISTPEHIRDWWEATTDIQPRAGSTSELVWAAGDDPKAYVQAITVVAAEPPRRFSFRWTHPADETAAAGNSNLVTFELLPSGSGTLLRLYETGFRERGWEAAVLEQRYLEHVEGWGIFVPRIKIHAEAVAASR